MRSVTIPFLLLSSLIVVACERAPVAPGGGSTPAFNWMNNPDNGNVRIVRAGTEFAVSWTDPRNGLRATHTTFPLGTPQETDCGPQEVLDPLDGQEVGLTDPDDVFASWLRANVAGRLWIIIRDVTQAGDCFGNKLIAEGWGTLHYTDNDVFGIVEGDKNTNAWGFGGSGTLTTLAGGEVDYSGHARFTFTADGGLTRVQPLVILH